MNKERKAILGQWHNNRLYFSDDEKRRIIEDYLSGNEVKRVVTCSKIGLHNKV